MTLKHLFVCGAGRSGTTFLWRVLNNSKQINLATEIHYFSSLYHNGFLSNLRKKLKNNKHISIKELQYFLNSGQHFGIFWVKDRHYTEKELFAFFDNKPITEKNIYQFLMENDVKRRDKKLSSLKFIGEKTPLNVFHIGQLKHWFPESTILFIYRTPLDVLKSEVNKREKPDYFLKKNNPLYSIGITLFVFFEWIFSAFIAIHKKNDASGRFMIVSYKQLLQQQERSVQLICEAIGIDYSNMLCVYKKIGSSFKNLPSNQHWSPPFLTKVFFNLFLDPIYKRLSKSTVNSFS